MISPQRRARHCQTIPSLSELLGTIELRKEGVSAGDPVITGKRPETAARCRFSFLSGNVSAPSQTERPKRKERLIKLWSPGFMNRWRPKQNARSRICNMSNREICAAERSVCEDLNSDVLARTSLMLPLLDLRAAKCRDGGTTVMLLGAALGSLGVARRFLKTVNSSNNFPIQKWPSFLVGHFFCTPSVPATSIAYAGVFGDTGKTRQPKLSQFFLAGVIK